MMADPGLELGLELGRDLLLLGGGVGVPAVGGLLIVAGPVVAALVVARDQGFDLVPLLLVDAGVEVDELHMLLPLLLLPPELPPCLREDVLVEVQVGLEGVVEGGRDVVVGELQQLGSPDALDLLEVDLLLDEVALLLEHLLLERLLLELLLEHLPLGLLLQCFDLLEGCSSPVDDSPGAAGAVPDGPPHGPPVGLRVQLVPLLLGRVRGALAVFRAVLLGDDPWLLGWVTWLGVCRTSGLRG